MKKILLLSLAFLACENVTTEPNEFSTELKAAFEVLKKNNDCKTSKIDEYLFKGQTVYLFDPGLCGADMFSPILDKNGKTICNLGGIIGNTKCDGVEFEKEAKFVKNVWKY
jgi:hypothetical protein